MPRRFADGLYHIKENPIEKTTFFKMEYKRNEVLKILEDRKKQIEANVIHSKTLF